MAEAKRDNNQVTTITASSNADGATPVVILANPATHEILANDGATGSDKSDDNADRDNNGVVVLMGVSSADGVTPVPIYADPATGCILIKST